MSASNVAVGKHAPDLFLSAAVKLEAGPGNCIVVEASAVGLVAAKAAGVTQIGFIGSPHAGGRVVPELKAAGARWQSRICER